MDRPGIAIAMHGVQLFVWLWARGHLEVQVQAVRSRGQLAVCCCAYASMRASLATLAA